MAFDNSVTIAGNVTRDPEVRFTPNGKAVCSFGVAVNEGKDKPAGFYDITCWDKLAENCAESIEKGTRVVVFGRLSFRSWEDKQETKHSKVEIVADDVSLSLKWATGRQTKAERRDGEQQHASQRSTSRYGGGDEDEEPF